MTWTRLDDHFDEHPTNDGLSDPAWRLYVTGLIWCGRNLTDGHIPASRATRLTASANRRYVDELVAAQRWLRAGDGFDVRNYLSWQPTKDQVETDRASAAERQRRRRRRRDGTFESQETSGVSHGVTNGVTHGEVTPGVTSTPTRPVGRVGQALPSQANGAGADAPLPTPPEPALSQPLTDEERAYAVTAIRQIKADKARAKTEHEQADTQPTAEAGS